VLEMNRMSQMQPELRIRLASFGYTSPYHSFLFYPCFITITFVAYSMSFVVLCNNVFVIESVLLVQL
jgi:hypothetical protein